MIQQHLPIRDSDFWPLPEPQDKAKTTSLAKKPGSAFHYIAHIIPIPSSISTTDCIPPKPLRKDRRSHICSQRQRPGRAAEGAPEKKKCRPSPDSQWMFRLR